MDSVTITPKRKRKLTKREKPFIDNILNPNILTITEAAIKAGYSENCAPQIAYENLNKPYLRQAIIERQKELQQMADGKLIDVHLEHQKQLEFAAKMRKSCELWLSDPNDESVFNISPRADEINIVYLDHEDCNKQGEPRRKTASLQEILARLDGTKFDDNAQFIKTIDMRDLALKTLDRVDATLDKFAKLGGLYTKERENPETLGNVAETLLRLADMCRIEYAERDVFFDGVASCFVSATGLAADVIVAEAKQLQAASVDIEAVEVDNDE